MTPLLLALSLGAALSAAVCIRANYPGPAGPRPRWHILVFKPLATTLIGLIAWLAPAPLSPAYQAAIVLGLVFSLAGDVFLMLPDHFLAGLVSFFIAHLCYGAGFAGWAWPALSPLWALPYAVVGAGLWWGLHPHLGRLRAPVTAYLIVIALMAWLASQTGWVAGVGAALFMVSDGVLAYERFVRPFPAARGTVLVTYWLAQWLIALSVWAAA